MPRLEMNAPHTNTIPIQSHPLHPSSFHIRHKSHPPILPILNPIIHPRHRSLPMNTSKFASGLMLQSLREQLHCRIMPPRHAQSEYNPRSDSDTSGDCDHDAQFRCSCVQAPCPNTQLCPCCESGMGRVFVLACRGRGGFVIYHGHCLSQCIEVVEEELQRVGFALLE